MDKVYLDKCAGYDEADLFEIIKRQFDSMGIMNEITAGMTVVVKPNLIMRTKPSENAITHPAVTEAVGRYVKSCGADVLIAESSGGPYTTSYMKNIFSGCGYTEIAQRNEFSLYTECKSAACFLPEGIKCKSLSVVKPFIGADYIIDIAKLKTHGMTGISACVKNLFGVVPGLEKPELHCRFPDKSDFADMLIDLCDFIKPDLCVIDAVYGMEGNGPTGGESRFVGGVLSAKNPFAIDVVAAELINIKVSDFPLLKNAAVRGFSPESIDNIQIIGEDITELKVTDYKPAKAASNDFVDRLPGFMRPFARRIATPKPRIRKNECIGCGKCAESCPQHIIKINNSVAVIELKDCISCFCCHEMCPKHVIDIKRLGVFKI